jgi:hypothetical protein
MKKENKKIQPNIKHLILCEGNDEKWFFIWYLEYLIKNGHSELDCIQIEDIGGNEDIKKQLGIWKLVSGFEQLETIGIIRDAEKNADAAVRSINQCFTDNGFTVPDAPFVLKISNNTPNTIYGVLPGFDENGILQNGTLEDLCLQILKDEQSGSKMNIIKEYLTEIQTKFDYQIHHIHKAKLHTYFASDDKFIGSKIGEASKIGAFDFESPKLMSFRKMFEEIIK